MEARRDARKNYAPRYLEEQICDAIADVDAEARAAIHQYHDREQDTTYIAGSCGTLTTP